MDNSKPRGHGELLHILDGKVIDPGYNVKNNELRTKTKPFYLSLGAAITHWSDHH